MNQTTDNKTDDFVEARPVTEEEVNQLRSKISKLSEADGKKINDLCIKYKQLVNGIITMAKKQTKEEDDLVEIERLTRLLGLCSCDELLYRSRNKIWAVRNKLINKDLDWFINRDYSKLIKKDNKATLIESLINTVKEYFPMMTQDERDIYWNKGLEMLLVVGNLKKLIGETN